MTQEEKCEKARAYSTTKVVDDYLINYNTYSGREREKCYRFFDNIVLAFGMNPETNRIDFWEMVYFGNYIDEICGVRDQYATNLLKNQDNREKYNDQLFNFITEYKIDIVFCFSRKVYNNLPPLEDFDIEIPGEKGNSQRLDKCVYYPGKRKQNKISLKKPVIIYGLHHPSQGFSYRAYRDRIKAIIEEERLFSGN